nr:immunoglobulin light chain junction region [Macaca mulatta]MOV94553.1 immunoglobulin light chain junction region [Macaca mulatta]MOV94674.1 immunoglobulin light chain junction region [Macaca mulatta]MOV94702.1 immunoglobulin light chain junction region [Macaca mulatta]MOV94725.1 immunoglobulin light chain junction region [Macaca mulatta]
DYYCYSGNDKDGLF